MTLNKKRLFYGPIFLAFLVTLVIFGCAVQQKPQGGPKDLDPPKLLKASPPNLTHNFNAKEIRLEFDEYFKLNNQYSEITIFPSPEKNPDIKKHQKTLVIDLKDTLLKNTTYVINFGKAIGDVNENNILKNFTYVFSTGTHIDSLTMSGTVTDNQTLLRVKDATVMLFTLKQDSLLFGKKKPSIYTTTDSLGNFMLSNLKEGDYKIYALKEPTAPDKVYDDDKELIGFSSHIIHFARDTSTIALKIFKQEPTKFRYLSKQFTNDGGMLFLFNKPLVNPSVKIIYPEGLDEQKLLDFSKTKDSLTIYSKNMDFDSVRMVFSQGNKPLDTTYLRKGRKESFTRILALRFGTTNNNELKNGTDLKIHTSLPVENFEPAFISLKEDSTEVKYTMTRDTGIGKTYTVKYPWRQKVSYTLTLEEGAFTDIYGDKSKRLIKKFGITKPDNYSSMALTVNLPDSTKGYVVELLNEGGVVLHSNAVSKAKKTVINYRNLYVGKFNVRVTYDDNKNGKWDSGSIKDNRQPENIWVYDKTFTIRPNWDSEETVDVPREAITP